MSRPAKVLGALCATVVTALALAACGTQKVYVGTSSASIHRGAVLFRQRCSGCHSLSYAASFGSAANVFTAQFNNGPNFNVRCERPAIRVLYAIENGGFSGAIMPQNIVTGKDARDVAKFVATYAGRQAPRLTHQIPCQQKSIGAIPAASTSTTTSTTSTTASAGGGSTSSASSGKSGQHSSKKRHP
jgi:mono/diheme cytochrome c family protein